VAPARARNLRPRHTATPAQILNKFEKEAEAHIMRVKLPHEPVRECASRFLRARKYDAEAAMAMVAASAEWREKENLERLAVVPTEEIIGCPEEELNAYYPSGHLPILDKDFRPVYIERTGHIDVPALMCSTTKV
jgi:hypothetical protein